LHHDRNFPADLAALAIRNQSSLGNLMGAVKMLELVGHPKWRGDQHVQHSKNPGERQKCSPGSRPRRPSAPAGPRGAIGFGHAISQIALHCRPGQLWAAPKPRPDTSRIVLPNRVSIIATIVEYAAGKVEAGFDASHCEWNSNPTVQFVILHRFQPDFAELFKF
jgi:hypothetical protein